MTNLLHISLFGKIDIAILILLSPFIVWWIVRKVKKFVAKKKKETDSGNDIDTSDFVS